MSNFTINKGMSNEFIITIKKNDTILPLNIPVEVKQGHINVLKEVEIPRHIQVGDNLSAVKMMPRYSISYEDMKA